MDGLTLEKLYDDSHIQDLKNEISKLCQNNVTEILDKNALNSLKEWIKTAQPLEDFIKLQDEINQRWKQDLEKWEAIDQKFNDIRLMDEDKEDEPISIGDKLAEIEEKIKNLFFNEQNDSSMLQKIPKFEDFKKAKKIQYAKADKELLKIVWPPEGRNKIKNQSRCACNHFVEKLQNAIEKRIDFPLNTKNNESLLLHAANYTSVLDKIKEAINSADGSLDIVSNDSNDPLIGWSGRLWMTDSKKAKARIDYFKNFQKRFEEAVKKYSDDKIKLIKGCSDDLQEALRKDKGEWQNEYNEKTKKITADIEFIREFQKDLSDLEEARKRVYQS